MRKKTLHFKSKLFLAGLGLLSFSTLSAQTLMHSYTFDAGTYDVTAKTVNDSPGSGVTAVNGTVNGSNWTIENGYFQNYNSARTSGGYISFDGAALALNTYSAITLEAYVSTNNDMNNPNHWCVLAYFGGAFGANSFMLNSETGVAVSRAIFNNATAATGVEPGKNEVHHYVAVLTPSTETAAGSVDFYIDGVLSMTTPLTMNAFNAAVSSIATTNAWLGYSAWNDPNYTAAIHEFNIYNGTMSAAAVAARYAERNTKLSSLTLSAGTLSPAFSSGINKYGVVLPDGTTSLTVGATTDQVGFTPSGIGTYDVSGEKGTITVKANGGAGDVPYTIYWVKDVASPVLTHSYTFNDGTAKDVVGTADGTIMGAGVIANGVYTTTAGANFASGNSQYISLPASDIAINEYPSVTLEAAVKGTAAGFVSYFGNQTLAAGTDYLYMYMDATSKSVSSCKQYNASPSGEITASNNGQTAINGNVHHLAQIMTQDSIYLYVDGIERSRTLLSNVNKLFNLKNGVAYLSRSGYPNDYNRVGTIGQFDIYKGKLDKATIAAHATTVLNDAKDATLSNITVSVGTLTFDPATLTYNVNVPMGTTSVTVGATATKDMTTFTGTGVVTLNPGGFASIVTKSGDGSTKTYTVNFIPPVPAISADKSSLSFNSETNAPQVITVTGLNLSDAISITAPAGITVSPTSLPANANSADLTVSYDGVTTVIGNISLASTGATTQNISVTGTNYSDCFVKQYPGKTNLVTEPYMNSLAAYSLSWGMGVGAFINSDPVKVVCGLNSGMITGKRAGSMTYPLSGIWAANSTYRIKAKVLVESGTFNFNVTGWSGNTADVVNTISANTDWQSVDFTFTTGATLGTSQYFYFNNFSSNATGVAYIDNVEMYLLPTLSIAEASIGAFGTNVGSTDSKVLNISAKDLDGDVSISLSGANADQFSVSSATLPSLSGAVESTPVTVNYTPTVTSANHTATLTISSANAVDKTFSLTGSTISTKIGDAKASNWNAYVVNGKLKVDGVGQFEVYTVQGLKVAQVSANASAATVTLNQGVYVVKTDKGIQKVIVK